MADLPAEIKVRVSLEMKRALAEIVLERRLGTKLSDICREAIEDYLKNRDRKPGRASKTRSRRTGPASD